MLGIDIHAHMCFPSDGDGVKGYEDVDKIVEQAKKEMKAIVASSARYEEGLAVLELSKKHPGFVFPTLGYHPVEGNNKDGIIKLIKENKNLIVGIGEVGMDFHWVEEPSKREIQRKEFEEFIQLAKEINKPIVIHSWDAEVECFEAVKDAGVQAIFHCFSGSSDLAKRIVEAGFWVSVSTQVCFSKNIKKIAKVVPLEQMFLETDAPFLDPDRERKQNTPWNIKLSAEKIAKIKDITAEEVLKQTTENAIKAFNLPL
ncbi:MAG: TatD family hydrolase [Candidatus Aenigmatarchaeota archaeon]